MELIYINKLGPDFKGQKQFEFIFSDTDEIEDENWYIIPSSVVNESLIPNVKDIKIIGLLKDTDIDLELVQESDYFGMIDAVDGIIPLGWEAFDEDKFERLYFKFGEKYEDVEAKLSVKNYKLIKQKNIYNEK